MAAKLTNAQLAVAHKVLGILDRQSHLVYVEEGRRRGFSLILAHDTMEHNWEILFDETVELEQTLRHGRVCTRHQFSIVELIIGEEKDIRMRPEVFDELHNAAGV